MNRPHDDGELPPILEEAYDAASDTADASELLRRRTVRELRRRGLIRPSGAPGVRGWVAAVLVGLAFLGGYAAGHGGGTPATSVSPRPAGLPSQNPIRGAELVQEASTDFVLAVEALAEDLDQASPAEVATAGAVLRSATEAQADPVRRLLASHEAVAPDGESVVWF